MNEKLQKFSPPFRDNFQTSLYLSSLLAITCVNGFSECENSAHFPSADWTSSPRVYEIGNHEAVNLSHKVAERASTYLDPQAPQKSIQTQFQQPKYYLPFFFSILILTIISEFFTPKQFHTHITRLAIITCTLLILFYLYTLTKFDFYGVLFLLHELSPNYFGSPDPEAVSAHLLEFTEPLSFTNGISSWPANAIRLLAILLALFSISYTHRQLMVNQKKTQDEFITLHTASPKDNQVGVNVTKKKNWVSVDNWRGGGFNFVETLFKYREKRKLRFSLLRLRSRLTIDNWKTNSADFAKNWLKFLEKIKLRYSVIRITGMFVAFAILISIILYIVLNTTNFIPDPPFRGEFNIIWSHRIFLITVLAYLALILYIADNVHASSHFIRLLADNRSIVWSSKLMKIYKKKYDLPENIIEYKILLDFVTHHTEAHSKFIYYPFFCLFLIIMSRNNYFDNWPTTPFILLIYVFFALISLISAIRLRAAALYAKNKILENLNTNSAQSPINEWRGRQYDNIIKLKSLITEIENFKEGIFRPLLHHPMILSLLVPFSSVGGIYLIEYLI